MNLTHQILTQMPGFLWAGNVMPTSVLYMTAVH